MAEKGDVNNNGRNYIDNIVGTLIFVAIMLYLYFEYRMDIWFFIKSNIFFGLAFVPQEYLDWLLWSFGKSELIHIINSDLIAHSLDYESYYLTDNVGIRKKSEIDIATLAICWPLPVFYIVFKLWKMPRSSSGKIQRPIQKFMSVSLYNYAETMQDIYPYIKPVIGKMKFFTEVGNLDEGYYANPMLPITWVINQKIYEVIEQPGKVRTLFMQSEKKKFTLNKDNAYMALKKQLGDKWKSIDDLSFVELCVLLIITSHAFGEIKESRLLNRMILNRLDAVREIMGVKVDGNVPKSKETDKLKAVVNKAKEKYKIYFTPQFFDVNEISQPFDDFVTESFSPIKTEQILKERGANTVKSVLLKHRYLYTVILALYDRSWMYGVLSASEVLWVKEFDRDLYFILSQQGRKACFIECAGPWSHYLAERAHGFRMLNPQLMEAIKGIDEDLYKTHENYIAHNDWSDDVRMRKLVPDIEDSGSNNPAVGNSSKTMSEQGISSGMM